MGKQFGQNNNRGGGGNRGGGQRGGGQRGGGQRGGGRGRGGRPGMDQGPPAFVVPYGTFLHRSQNSFVVKCTDCSRVPKFNRGVYLESKARVGSVDEILGPTTAFYFSVNPAQGINVDTFKPGQLLFMNPQDLLPMDRFTKKPAPKGPRPSGPGGRPNTGRPPQGRPNSGGNFQKGGNRPAGNFNQGGAGGNFTKKIFKK